MCRKITKALHLPSVAVLGVGVAMLIQASIAQSNDQTINPTNIFHWQSAAKLHRGLRAATGMLVFNKNRIEFHSDDSRIAHIWPYVEVKTFALTPRRIVITSYENRSHRMPGERRFCFELSSPIPAPVAGELARRVNKPVENGDPDPNATAYLTVPARRGTCFGGTNGILRFRDEGIDYVTSGGQGSRSWRWADIQTVANPTPFQLRVGGYLETFEFELKQPISTAVFDRLWDHLYARDLNIRQTPGGQRHAD